MVIEDADIIIELMRKNPAVRSLLSNEIGYQNVILSCITVAEILEGAGNKEDFFKISKYLNQFIVVPIDYPASEIFSSLIRKFVLRQDTGIPDTIVLCVNLQTNHIDKQNSEKNNFLFHFDIPKTDFKN